MLLRVIGGLVGTLALMADVGSDRERLTYLLGHVEEKGRLLTRIYALQSHPKKICWTFDTSDTFEVRPARVGRTLVVPSGKRGVIHGVSASTGKELWQISVEPFRCMLALDERTFVICGRNTRVACYERDGSSTTQRWEKDLPVQAREVWKVGDRLCIPTYRNILCVEARTGRVVWDFVPSQGECLYVRPSGREIYAWDWWRQELYALEAETGKLLWEKSGPASPCVLALQGSTLLITHSGGRHLQAFDGRSGKEEWTLPNLDLQRTLPPVDDLVYYPFITPVISSGDAYVVTDEQKIARCSLKSGTLQDQWSAGGTVIGLAALPDAILVAVSDRWVFYQKNGDKIGELPIPSGLRYLRSVE